MCYVSLSLCIYIFHQWALKNVFNVPLKYRLYNIHVILFTISSKILISCASVKIPWYFHILLSGFRFSTSLLYLQNFLYGSREMSQHLGRLIALSEDPGLIPSIHVRSHSCLQLQTQRIQHLLLATKVIKKTRCMHKRADKTPIPVKLLY